MKNSKSGILLGESSIQIYSLECPARTRVRAHSTERVNNRMISIPMIFFVEDKQRKQRDRSNIRTTRQPVLRASARGSYPLHQTCHPLWCQTLLIMAREKTTSHSRENKLLINLTHPAPLTHHLMQAPEVTVFQMSWILR